MTEDPRTRVNGCRPSVERLSFSRKQKSQSACISNAGERLVWIAILLPPLLVPQVLRRPDRCQACGAEGTLQVHQRLVRRVRYITVSVDERQGWSSESHSRGVRFRCRSCKRTSSSTTTGGSRGSITTPYVKAYVVTWYCLGLKPAAIYQKLADYDLQMSRASVYRLIASAVDNAGRSLHRARRSTFESLTVYSMDRHRPELCLQQPLTVSAMGDPFGEVAIIRSTAFVFKLYGNFQNRAMIAWLDRFLSQFGLAGVFVYATRRSLDRDFNPNQILARRLSSYASLVSEQEILRPPDNSDSSVQAIIAGAARLSEIEPAPQPLPDPTDVFDIERDPTAKRGRSIRSAP